MTTLPILNKREAWKEFEDFIDDYYGEGLKDGEIKGMAKILVRQMEARFGALPQWAEQKIEHADIAAVEDWSIRLLNANSLKEVLNENETVDGGGLLTHFYDFSMRPLLTVKGGIVKIG